MAVRYPGGRRGNRYKYLLLSRRRQQQAADTRRDILGAARALFAQQGYPGTSVEQIAAAAGVAVPTLYKSVGTKRAILGELAAGLEAPGARLRDAVLAAADARAIVAAVARAACETHVRDGDVQAALASAGGEAAALLAERERRHRESMRMVAKLIAQAPPVPAGYDSERAAVTLSVLTGRAVYAQLTEQHGWDAGRAEAWIRGALERELLQSSSWALK